MMKDEDGKVIITGIFGDDFKTLKIGKVAGVPHIWWDVTIGYSPVANIKYLGGQWVVSVGRAIEFCYEDEQILIDIIKSEERLLDPGKLNET